MCIHVSVCKVRVRVCLLVCVLHTPMRDSGGVAAAGLALVLDDSVVKVVSEE